MQPRNPMHSCRALRAASLARMDRQHPCEARTRGGLRKLEAQTRVALGSVRSLTPC